MAVSNQTQLIRPGFSRALRLMRRILPMLSFFGLLAGCNQAEDVSKMDRSDEHTCVSAADDEYITDTATYKAVRGALLGTRFASLEELKSVIRIEYGKAATTSDSTASENAFVRVRHCSHGREVVSVLESGVSQGDVLKARYGDVLDRLSLFFRSPYTVMNRKDLERIFVLSRRKSEWFGEGDLAFFDIAASSVARINTPDIAFVNTRDSTEKGYLNSINHITAQAFITSCFSEEMADFIADAHERHSHPELITGKFTAKQIADLEEGPVDNYVDVVNNEWGQELGKQLKEKYKIDRETHWTPELLADYLNDLLRYYSWAFQIGFKPYKPEDEEVLRFSNKLDALIRRRLSF